MTRLILFILFSFASFGGVAQKSTKQLAATRTSSPIRIDGVLDDVAWKGAVPATGFIEQRPNPGQPENYATRTEFFMLYDNTAIYVAGFLHESTKDSIAKELVGRDKVGVNDYAGVMLDTYNDKINAVGFYVTPLGEQFDCKYSPTNEDMSWSAVWDSETMIHENGWSFEMRIPYSALRFVSSGNQTWGLNLVRGRTKTAQQFFWSPVDPKVGGFVNQGGEWTGIANIEAPVRLSFSPYLSAYANHYKPDNKDLRASVNGGMDVKWGISESFTIDMTLIPDFGQVQSDNQVLNLSPFEVRYSENRPFFTEGTELFNKGNLFYSRRVGNRPLNFGAAHVFATAAKGKVLSNPQQSKLLNATKLSGRTKSGLGIGVFNAVTKAMFAEVEDSLKQVHRVETSPLTNYNILVLDQNLKNNSSVSLVNTNVLREGSAYDANVTAGMFTLNNKKNSFRIAGQMSVSHQTRKTQGSNGLTGFEESFDFGKTGGRWNFQFSHEISNHQFNKNDLGIMNTNNYIGNYFWTGYRWIQPGKWYKRAQLNFNAGYNRLFRKYESQQQSNMFQSFNVNINGNAQLKNLWWAGAFMGYVPEGNDFYEPHHAGWSYKSTERLQFSGWAETNSAKKYYVSLNYYVALNERFNGRNQEINLRHRYRFNDKFSLNHDLNLNPFSNDAGYYASRYKTVNSSPVLDSILFARRDRVTVENVLGIKYSFSNKSGITVRVRHYWSEVDLKEFYALRPDGTLKPTTTSGQPGASHANYFNVDAQYTLQFAPGSFINIVWKDESQYFHSLHSSDYFKNFNRTLSEPQNNNLSIKIIYYLDYLDLKKKRK